MIKKIQGFIKKKNIAGILFATPALLVIGLMMIFPIGYLFFLSFHKWVGHPVWNGVSNYISIFNDGNFLKSLFNTFFYTAVNLTFGFALSFVFALIMNQAKRGIKFFRAIIFSPVIMPTVVVGSIWMWLLNSSFGVVNFVLKRLGLIANNIGWLGSSWMARLSISMVNVWLGTGLTAVILLAGLQGIPKTLYEAAKVDGANAFQQFVHVTIPQMRGIIIIALILKTIGSFKTFGQIYVMTFGGPTYSTSSIVFYLYREAFSFFNFGRAATMSVVLFLIVITLSVIQLYFRNED